MRIAWKLRVAGWSPGRPRPRTPPITRASSPVVRRGRARAMARASARARGSSPKAARMRASSRSGHWFTISAALGSLPASTRISSGASTRKLKPRAGSSSWRELTPRSSSTASAPSHPSSASTAASSLKRAWRRTTRSPGRRSAARARAARSRSSPRSRAPGAAARRAAAWPPRPPKRSPPSPLTSTSARARRRLMLTESLALQPELVQEVRVVLEELLLVVAVDLMIDVLGPDAELVGRTDEHHLAPDARVLAQRGRDQHAPLRVELHVLGGADVVGFEGRQLAVEALLGGDLLLEPLPPREGVHVEARTSAASELGDHEALVLEPGEHLSKAGRDGDPPLVVHQVLMGTAEHSVPYSASLPYHPKAPIRHPPPRPTTIPHRGIGLYARSGDAVKRNFYSTALSP